MNKLLVSILAGAALAGAAISDFDVTSAKDGEQVKYSSLKGDITVVIFVSTSCPISNSYNERMKAVYNDYTPRGARFIFINANNNESAAEVAEHAKAHDFPFAVYKDKTGAVADLFGAQMTPEAFVIDKDGAIRYHGYIDDASNEARVHNQGLRLALDAVLAGKPVPIAQTKAFGCTIKRRRAS